MNYSRIRCSRTSHSNVLGRCSTSLEGLVGKESGKNVNNYNLPSMTATIKEVGTSTSCRLRHGTRFFRSFSLLCDNKDNFRQQRKKYEQVNRSHEKDKGLADLLLALGWKLDVPLSGTCTLWRGTFTVGTIYCGRLQIRTPQRVWPRTRTLACVTPFRLRHKVFSALMQL